MLQSQSLLQQKMALEQKWAKSFLEEGKVTLECNEIDQEIKALKRQMISNDEFIAHKTNTDAFSIAGQLSQRFIAEVAFSLKDILRSRLIQY